MKLRLIACVFVLLSATLMAQTNTWNVTTTVISLPGNKSTVAGTDAGMALTVTPNFDIRDENIVSSNMQYYGGGFNYRLPSIAKWINNGSATNFPALDFKFYLDGTFGMVSAPASSGVGSAQHYGFTAGGGVLYQIAGSQTWALGAEINYAKFPGYNNNTFVVKVGPSISF